MTIVAIFDNMFLVLPKKSPLSMIFQLNKKALVNWIDLFPSLSFKSAITFVREVLLNLLNRKWNCTTHNFVLISNTPLQLVILLFSSLCFCMPLTNTNQQTILHTNLQFLFHGFSKITLYDKAQVFCLFCLFVCSHVFLNEEKKIEVPRFYFVNLIFYCHFEQKTNQISGSRRRQCLMLNQKEGGNHCRGLLFD